MKSERRQQAYPLDIPCKHPRSGRCLQGISLHLRLCCGKTSQLPLDPSCQLFQAEARGTLKQLLIHVQAPPPRPVPAKDIPSHLRVCCGGLRGNFDVQRALVILDGGREISPTEFERMAGKAASKKWKASVRIDKVPSHVFNFS